MVVVIVDGSYYVFWRLHALYAWYNRARRPDEPECAHQSPRVRDKYCELFATPLEKLFKREGWTIEELYIAKDCPQDQVWRKALKDDYKAGRTKRPEVKHFMTAAYQGGLFQKLGPDLILECPKLEADDCAALMVKRILATSDRDIVVITGDKDYLQLASDRVQIWNMNGGGTCLACDDGHIELLKKVLIGDPSDNIKGVIGVARAKRLLASMANKSPAARDEYLQAELSEGERAAYQQNRQLISFECIPDVLSSAYASLYPLRSVDEQSSADARDYLTGVAC